MGKHEFHIYASTKTSAQLFLDIASAVSHSFSLFALLKSGTNGYLADILFYLIIVTIVIQLILGFGLFTLRLMGLNQDGSNRTIPKLAVYLNNIFFWACLVVALLEVGIAGIEKLVIEGHGPGRSARYLECPPTSAPNTSFN